MIPAQPAKTSAPVRAVLFLCTGNSARSVIAECILNRAGMGRFKGHSAGSHPKGEVHPFALQLLRSLDHDVSGLRSKSWSEFAEPGAPELRELGVTHVLIVAPERPDPEQVVGVEWLFSHAHNHLYRIAAEAPRAEP